MGRLFVCGDIHGAYDKLMAKLDEIGFDKGQDMLFALGDLVDRGPDSMKVLRLLDEPWFDSIKGNHELMLEQRFKQRTRDTYELHATNGGLWFGNLTKEEQAEAFAYCERLPLTMILTTPSGRKVGLVHAEIPGDDWAAFEEMIESDKPHLTEAAWATGLWGRTKIKAVARDGPKPPAIRNIDAVYMGHTPTNAPVRHENMHWIDTGACWDDGYLTIEELT